MATPMDIDVRTLAVTRLLSLYAQILTELLHRGVVRTRNAPAGDLAELLVAKAYHGDLAANSVKSWDVAAADGRHLQVKCRVVQAGNSRSHTYSPFRSWGFDACVFVVLEASTYEVVGAVEVPVEQVEIISSRSAWVAGDRVRVNQDLLRLPGAVDVTNSIREALSAVDETLVSTQGAALDSGASIDAAEIMVITQTPDVEPNGWCFCGCGEPTKPGKFFVITHDRTAEAKIIRESYGNIAGFVAAHGYSPGVPANTSDGAHGGDS